MKLCGFDAGLNHPSIKAATKLFWGDSAEVHLGWIDKANIRRTGET
jgi:hypothetical protein